MNNLFVHSGVTRVLKLEVLENLYLKTFLRVVAKASDVSKAISAPVTIKTLSCSALPSLTTRLIFPVTNISERYASL